MEVRVGIHQDEDTGLWSFVVPALNIVGGACLTREEALDHVREAIEFTLEARPNEPGYEIVSIAV